MGDKVASISQDDFNAEVRQSDLPVLVDFWAPWCGPCRALAPVLDQVAEAVEGRVRIVKVNVDENTKIASEFNIMGIPTLMLFDKGEVKDVIRSAVPKDYIISFLDKNLAAV